MIHSLIGASVPPTALLVLLALAACTESPVAPSRETPNERLEPARAPVVSVTDLGTLGGDWSEGSGINSKGQVVGFSQTASGAFHAALWENGTVTDLGTLPGGDFSGASGINDRGQVVGFSQTVTGEFRAVLWENGNIMDLGTLGGVFGEARGINNRGQVVGFSTTATGELHAALWENGTITDLGIMGGFFTLAQSINNRARQWASVRRPQASSAPTSGGERHLNGPRRLGRILQRGLRH